MTNSVEHSGRISGIGRAAGAALKLALVFLLAIVAIRSGQAQTFRILHEFKGTPDGSEPTPTLIRDVSGNLYGVTIEGGTSCDCGTVFKVDPSGHETVLYRFTGGPDGGFPAFSATLVRDASGNLYGTTGEGGDLSCDPPYGCGVVFKVDSDLHESVLYTFAGGADGGGPQAGLVRDTAGNLYGTTLYGGDLNAMCFGGTPPGCGVVFKLDSSGTETVLYTFKGMPDAGGPNSGLMRDAAGNLYGTTTLGGQYNWGTVFKLTQSGTTVLHSFNGGRDGADLYEAGLIRDAKGNLYGVASGGGKIGPGCETSRGCGLVFKVTKTGKETVLYKFTGKADGSRPYGTLVRDKAGNLYGTTSGGGAQGYGTVFKLTSTGKETVLHNFIGKDGSEPLSGLVLDAKGNLYGSTWEGGFLEGGGVRDNALESKCHYEKSPAVPARRRYNRAVNALGAL